MMPTSKSSQHAMVVYGRFFVGEIIYGIGILSDNNLVVPPTWLNERFKELKHFYSLFRF